MDHPEPAKLPPTAWAVLGVLAFGEELTGYEVRQWADHVLRFFYWSPAMSQIYSELKRLEQVGYAASRSAVSDDGRGKRVYAITGPGEAALAEWAGRAPVEPPVLKHGPMLRVWLGHLSTPERLRAQLLEHRADMERMLAEAESSQELAVRFPEWAYPELTIRWAIRYYTAQRDLADRMLADLEAEGRDGEAEPLRGGEGEQPD